MPTYDMSCGNCNYEKEHYYPRSEDAVNVSCPECKEGKLEKQVSLFGTSSPSSKGSSFKVPEGILIQIEKFKDPNGNEFILAAELVKDDGTEERNRAIMSDSSMN